MERYRASCNNQFHLVRWVLFLFAILIILASCGNPLVRDFYDSQNLELTLVFAQSRSLGVATDFDGKIVTVKLFRQSAPAEPLKTSTGPIQFSTTTQTPQYIVAFSNVPASADLFLTAEIADTDSSKTVYFQGQSSIFRMTQVGTATLDLSVNPVTFPDTAKTLTSLSFRADLNSNLTQTYPVTIVGTTIELSLPDGTDRNLIPTFAHTGAAVKVAGTPITSGVTQIDFTDPVVFTIEDRQATVETIEYTITVLLAAPPPPASPTGLTFQQVNDASLLLNWSAATGIVDGYRIYRDNVLYQTLGPGVLNYSTNTFTAGTPITYEVRAFNAEGESTPTTPLSVTPLGGFNILTPINGANPVVLTPEITWDPSIGATSYTISITQSGTPVITETSAATSYNVSSGDLNPLTTFDIIITATNSDFTLSTPPITFTTRGPILYVDGTVGIGNDLPTAGITPGTPFQTIQYALSQAITGDEIRIAEGVYQGGFTITKSVTLSGDWNTGFTIQDPSPGTTITTPATAQTTIIVNSPGIDVTLKNLRVELKNPSVATNFSALTVFDSNTVLLDSIRAIVNDSGIQPFASAIFIGNGATSVTIRSSQIQLSESGATSDSAGIEVVGVFNGDLMIGGPTPEDGNTFLSSSGSNMNHHIRVTSGNPTPAPNFVIQYNTFQSLTGTVNQLQHSIYSQSSNSQFTILDNYFYGNQNVGTNSVYSIHIGGNGLRDIRRNFFDLQGDINSPIHGIVLHGAGTGGAIIDSNKMRFVKENPDTLTGLGIILDRPALVMNNIIVQEGEGTGGDAFRPITINSGDVDLFHNAFINRATNALFEAVFVQTGNLSHRFTNNIFYNDSGTASGIVIVTNPTIFGEIDSNQFGGFAEADLLTGVTTLANLNSAANANGNILALPSFLTPASMENPTWYEPDMLYEGSTTHAAVVLQDINGISRGTPPQIGAYE
jgi:hypothetical protein